MNDESFRYWLQGLLEFKEGKGLTPEEVLKIKEELDKLFASTRFNTYPILQYTYPISPNDNPYVNPNPSIIITNDFPNNDWNLIYESTTIPNKNLNY